LRVLASGQRTAAIGREAEEPEAQPPISMERVPASILLHVRGSIELPTGFHPFVPDANDLDDARLHGAIVDDVDGPLNSGRVAMSTDMSQVEASYPWNELFPILGHSAFWIRCNLSHRRRQQRGVPTSALATPSLGTRH
jgi:hypothetical protein